MAAVQRPRVRNARAGGGVRAAGDRRHAAGTRTRSPRSTPARIPSVLADEGRARRRRLAHHRREVVRHDRRHRRLLHRRGRRRGTRPDQLPGRQAASTASPRSAARASCTRSSSSTRSSPSTTSGGRLEGPRHARRRPRADQGVVHGRAAADRGPLAGRCRALPRRGPRVRLRATPVRSADLRLPGGCVPARRLRRGAAGGAGDDLPGGVGDRPQAGRREDAACEGGVREAVRVPDGEPRRRPLRAGAGRPRLHAGEPRRAALPRSPRRPDLGGHRRGPEADRRERAGEARARRRSAAWPGAALLGA